MVAGNLPTNLDQTVDQKLEFGDINQMNQALIHIVSDLVFYTRLNTSFYRVSYLIKAI